MSQLLHYPRRSCSLNDLASQACINPADAEAYVQVLSATNKKQADAVQSKSSPIILPNGSHNTFSLPQCTAQEHKTLATLSHQVGGAGVLALADMVHELTKDNGTTFAGGAGAALTKTSNLIVGSIDNYQKELKIYEDLRNHGAVKATLARQEPKVKKAFNHMNTILDKKGQQFLHKHTVKTRQTTNLNGKIVRESIPITNHSYVKKLSTLAKVGKVAGPGLVLLDGFIRYDKVHDMYKDNNAGWKRQAVVESSSFAAGVAAAGIIATFVVFAVPGAIVIGLVAGGMAAVMADQVFKNLSGKAYDLLQ